MHVQLQCRLMLISMQKVHTIFVEEMFNVRSNDGRGEDLGTRLGRSKNHYGRIFHEHSYRALF